MTKYKYSLCIKNKNDQVQPQNIGESNCLLRSKSGSESWPKMIQKVIKRSPRIIKMAQNEFTLGREIKYHSSTITFLQTQSLWKLQSKPNTHKMVLDWTQKNQPTHLSFYLSLKSEIPNTKPKPTKQTARETGRETSSERLKWWQTRLWSLKPWRNRATPTLLQTQTQTWELWRKKKRMSLKRERSLGEKMSPRDLQLRQLWLTLLSIHGLSGSITHLPSPSKPLGVAPWDPSSPSLPPRSSGGFAFFLLLFSIWLFVWLLRKS